MHLRANDFLSTCPFWPRYWLQCTEFNLNLIFLFFSAERETGRDAGLVNGRGLGRSHSFANQHSYSTTKNDVVRESGDRPVIKRSSSEVDTSSRRHVSNDSWTDLKSGEIVQERSSAECFGFRERKSSKEDLVKRESTNKSERILITDQSKLSDSKSVSIRKPPIIPNGIRRTSIDPERSRSPKNSSSSESSVENSHSNVQPLSFSSSRLARKSSTAATPVTCQNSQHSSPSNEYSYPSRRSQSVVESNIGPIPKIRDDQSNKTTSDHATLASKWLEGKEAFLLITGKRQKSPVNAGHGGCVLRTT